MSSVMYERSLDYYITNHLGNASDRLILPFPFKIDITCILLNS